MSRQDTGPSLGLGAQATCTFEEDGGDHCAARRGSEQTTPPSVDPLTHASNPRLRNTARPFWELEDGETSSPVLSRQATEENMKSVNSQLSDSEKQQILRAFRACDEHNRSFIDRAGVKSFMKQLNMQNLDDALLDRLLEDFKHHDQNRYDFQDMSNLFLSWRTFSVLELTDTKDWTHNPYVMHSLLPKGRGLFLSDSVEMTVWNLFIMLCALVHWVIVFYRDSTEGVLSREPHASFLAVVSLLTVAYIVDMVFAARTLPISKTTAQPILDPIEVRMTYIKSARFVIDLASMVPLDIICSASGASAAAGILSHLRLLKPITALSSMEMSGRIPLGEYYILFYFQVMPLVRIFYIALCFMFFFAAVLCGIKNAQDNVESLSEKGNAYVVAMYFVVQTFTTVGYGDISMVTPEELWFGVVLVVIGLLFNGLVIGKLVSIVQMGSASSERQEKLRQTLAVLQFFEIPQQLQVEILNFQAHVLWSVPHAAFPEVVNSLPDVMRRNIDIVQKVTTLGCIQELKGCHDVVLVQLAKGLVSKTTRPEDYVTCYSDNHQGIRMLLFGFVDKIDRNGRYITTLRTGDVYGFADIIELTPERYSLKALSYCDLQILPPMHFHKVMNDYPSFSAHMQNVLDETGTDSADLQDALAKVKSLHFTKSLLITGPETEQGYGIDDGSQTPHNNALRSLFERTRLFKERLIKCKDANFEGKNSTA